MKRIVLINPNQMKPAVCPIALDYLASFLHKKRHRVDILDLCFSPDYKKDIDSCFEEKELQAIGISLRNTDDSCYSSSNFFLPRFKEIINYLRLKTDIPIILGGAGFSVMPEKIMEYLGVSLGIWGEGEAALSALLDCLGDEGKYAEVPGLIYRRGERLVRNPSRFICPEELGFSERLLVDNPRYFREGGMVGLETKRGCDKACIYCVDPRGKGRKVRVRPPRYVIEEIKRLIDQGVNYFHLCDSEFNLPESHAEEVCREIIRHGLGEKIHWYTYASPHPFSRGLAFLMKKAGCAGIDFGVDSGNDQLLSRLGRDFTKHEIRATAQICHQMKLTFMYDLLLGGPDETRETIKETIELMQEVQPTCVGISLGIRIYPGTRLADLVLREGPPERNQNLKGKTRGNQNFFEPIFYHSSGLGERIEDFVEGLIDGNPSFFLLGGKKQEGNYNYNENVLLVKAIKAGYRGAFWHILRKIIDDQPQLLAKIE